MKKNISLLSFLGLIVVLITSCTTNELLDSNFNSHNVGYPPIKSIPNSIAEDSILYESSISPRLKIISLPTIDGVEAHKELEFSNVPVVASQEGGHSRTWLNFKGIRTDLSSIVTFSWLIKVDRTSSDLITDLQDGYYNHITRILINRAGEIRIPEVVYDWECKRIIGRITDFSRYYWFTIHLNARTNKFDLIIIGRGLENSDPEKSGGTINISGEKPFEDLLKKEGEMKVYPKPEILFNWDNYSLGGRCLISNVTIKKQ